MILGITEHRCDRLPDKKTGYKLPNPTYNYVCQNIEKQFRILQPEKIITGMALGVDQWAASIAYNMKIPFVAAVPFEGQEIKWVEKNQIIYHKLLEKASEVVFISSGKYDNYKFKLRNKWIVDYSDKLLAIWDGSFDSGTSHAVEYALSLNREIIRIDPTLTPKAT